MKEYRIEMYDGFDWLPAFNTWGQSIESSNDYGTIDFRLRKLKADWSNPVLREQEMMPTVVPSRFRIVEREVGDWVELERTSV